MTTEDAYNEGWEAHEDGLDYSLCPYPYDSSLGESWTRGFQDAEDYEYEQDDEEEEDY